MGKFARKKIRFIVQFLLAFLLALPIVLSGSIAPQTASALNNGLSPTPPMGWNSWNFYACNVDEVKIKQAADTLVSSGMQAAGYKYIVIDDCWQTGRTSDGTIIADPVKFPSGMASLASYVHSKGLKFGLYTDAGFTTCAGKPGMYSHEFQDANTFASWGGITSRSTGAIMGAWIRKPGIRSSGMRSLTQEGQCYSAFEIGASTNHGCGVQLQVICGGRRTISSTTGIE
ncbi:glycoside hydrolase family 27 protein [Paenibacillus sp. Soil724D2]|uniref:glycoside hydrolase family 27 protein n=1 Tax=Paenibacillus sp. (strain Soil724D2) TaxID=1736392 RepID=UPI0007C6495D|nr:glycoside hydrolase family 27 protein [Paenibacillus sp. Soil724D2]